MYKSKSGGVLQECPRYRHVDIMQMKNNCPNFFDGSLQPQNKTKLNAQCRRRLETCLLHEIFVVV
jgi:hypothetical protein